MTAGVPNQTPTPRFAPWIPISVIWLLGAIPIGVWAGMFVHAVRASRFLGRWPHYDNPDPKALPPHVRSESLETAIGVALIALTIILGIQFTRRRSWGGRFGAAIIGAIVLWIIAVLLFKLDPGGIVEWYAD